MDPWDDRERYFAVVIGVKPGDGGCEVRTARAHEWRPDDARRGASIWLRADAAPEPGEIVVMWGQGTFGSLFRGMARLDGTVLHYISEDEYRAQQQAWLDERNRERQARFETERDRAGVPTPCMQPLPTGARMRRWRTSGTPKREWWRTSDCQRRLHSRWTLCRA